MKIVLIITQLIMFYPDVFSQNVGIGTLTPAHRLDVNGVINSNSEYRLSGKPFVRWGDPIGGLYGSLYVGDSAGVSNTGGHNTFIGAGSGRFNTTGYGNCFIGYKAGYYGVTCHDNTFIGDRAGELTTGFNNAFLGSETGARNLSGHNNTFLGTYAGGYNTSGSQNVFLGAGSGVSNVNGYYNVFIGSQAGQGNIAGGGNTLIGAQSNVGSQTLDNVTAIGQNAYATQSNTLILGSINGVNGASADTRVGIGTTTPDEKLDVAGNIRLTGEINQASTGSSNLLPVAYGSITSSGGINSGTGNFSVTRTAAGTYNIDITGHTYSFATYSTVVTSVTGPLVATANSLSGNLIIRLYDLSGVLTDGLFHFVIYKQ